MDPIEYILVIVNLILGFGCAVPLARLLRRLKGQLSGVSRHFVILVGIYFVECVAVVVAMGMPVFSVGLAFIWGIVFGLWLRNRAPTCEVLKTSFFLALYSSLPAISFILIPVMAWVKGWHILSPADGARFGIPDFLHLPWPLDTILGFYAALVVGAILFKSVITTGEVSLIIHFKEKQS